MSRRTAFRDDRGSGTLLVLWVALLVLAVGIALAAVSAVRVAQARAASAADLGALAGAAAAQRGDDACARARAIARRGGSAATACHVADDGVVEVSVEVPLGGAMRRFGPVRADAKAGPAAFPPAEG